MCTITLKKINRKAHTKLFAAKKSLKNHLHKLHNRFSEQTARCSDPKVYVGFLDFAVSKAYRAGQEITTNYHFFA